jgi:GPH family glycoside/pentoside/hexuronide:cation symporter
MIADVVDVDELETRERREGMYGSIFWWTVKLGLSAALAMSGYVLNATGFDVALGSDQAARTITLMRVADIGIPVATSAVALWAVARYPITETVANEVRRRLEERRGKV